MTNEQPANCGPAGQWRLHWMEPAIPQPGLTYEEGEEVGMWIGSDDPQKVRRYVGNKDWPDDKRLRVTYAVDERADWISVVCSPVEIQVWTPSATALLPEPRDLPPAKPTRAACRLALLQVQRGAIDRAVADGVLHPDDAAGLMLLTREALDRFDRARRDR